MNNSLQPYTEYMDSGLPWLGDIPAHWELRKFKYVFSERVEKGYPNEPLLAATQTKGVIPKDKYENRTVTATKDLHLLKLVEKGDYVISLRSFQGGIEYAHYRGIISPAYTILKPSSKALRSYFEFYFKSIDFVDSLTLFVTGIREGQNIDYERLSRSILPIPPQDEQIAIGKFLKHKLQELSLFIESKRLQIKLLNEQKQIIIENAVLRGLDLSVKLMSSETDWLGDIPSHWNIAPMKYYFREVDERSRTGTEELLSVSHITGVTPRSQKNITMFLAASNVNYKICKPGDLVINTMWAWMAALGISRQIGIVSPSYAVYRLIAPNNFSLDYLDYLLHTAPYKSEYRIRSTGIRPSRLRLYPEKFLTIRLLQPSRLEQENIVSFIKKEIEPIERAITEINSVIDTVIQYRTRLIADVVTGKLDVRETAKNLPEIETLENAEQEPMEDDELSDELEESEEMSNADE